LLLAGGGTLVFLFAKSWLKPQRDDFILHTVGYERLELTVVEKGNLEAAENTDVICRVKAGGRGSNFATTIKWIIDPGTRVMSNRPEHLRKDVRGGFVWPHTYHSDVPLHRRGKPMTKDEAADPATSQRFEKLKVWSDLLVELDSAGLEDQERQQQIAVNTAEAAVIKAKGDLDICISQNESDLKTAEVKVKIAELAEKSYREGEYLAKKAELEGKLEQSKDRAAYSKRMEAKGFLSSAAAEADQLALKNLEEQYRVLTKFDKEKFETQLKSDFEEAKRNLERVKTQNKAKLETAENELKTKKDLRDQEIEKLKDLREQISHCQLYAPGDGLVVYFQSEQERSGFGQQSTIAQGEQVREGQRLIRIPSLDQMLVNTRVHEAMVSRVKSGLPVDIRLDAFPDLILKGTVRTVGTVAMKPEWRSSSDVKMYLTTVTIDGAVPGLKPDMTAECTIRIDATPGKVLTVPVQAIVGGAELGPNRKVYVKTPGGWEEREIVLGLNNEKMVEVKSGLKEGEQVILNPKVLLGETAKTRQPGEFESKNAKQQGENGKAPEAKDSKMPGAGASDKDAPGASGGGGKKKFDPAEFKKKFDEDPEFRKKMLEKGYDPSKMKGKAGGAP